MMKFQVDGRDVKDDLNVLLNCHVHYEVVNSLFLQLNKFAK